MYNCFSFLSLFLVNFICLVCQIIFIFSILTFFRCKCIVIWQIYEKNVQTVWHLLKLDYVEMLCSIFLIFLFFNEVFFFQSWVLIFISIDSSNHKEESVEVGVIVMGLCCICLVACALVVLQLRSNSRRISGNRQRSGPMGDSGDRSRYPLDVRAPPSYDAGMLINTFCGDLTYHNFLLFSSHPRVNLSFKMAGMVTVWVISWALRLGYYSLSWAWNG